MEKTMVQNRLISLIMNICILIAMPVFASPINTGVTNEQIEQRDIKTIQDFEDIEKTLEEAIKLGDNSKLFVLGSLYMEDFDFKKSDKIKAKNYLEKALNEKYGLSAIPLSYIYIEKNDLDAAFIVLDKGIGVSEKDLNTQVILAVLFNGLILDFKSDDLRYVHKALDLTYPISQKTNKSALDFTIANLLNLAGNYEEANKYLNTACNNPEIDDELKNSCNKSIGITNNIKKSHECNTCGVVK